MPAIAGTTEPREFVLRRDEEIDEIARLGDVAFVVVELPEIVRLALIVEEAEMMRPRVVVGARYPLPCTEN